MSERQGEKPKAQAFPRRDADGRVISLAELVGAALGGTVVGLAAVALIDGLTTLLGLSDFGSASGWLAAILPAFVFVEDFRGWKAAAGWRRWPVALVALTAGIGLGLLAAGLVDRLPNLLSGAVGAAVLAVVAALTWYSGMRVMDRGGAT